MPRSKFNSKFNSKLNSKLKRKKPARKSKLRNKRGGSNMRVNETPPSPPSGNKPSRIFRSNNNNNMSVNESSPPSRRTPSPNPWKEARSSRRSTVRTKPSSSGRSGRSVSPPSSPVRSGRPIRPGRPGISVRSGRFASPPEPGEVKGPRTPPPEPEAVKGQKTLPKSASPAESDRCNEPLLSVINAGQAITTLANCLDPVSYKNFFEAMSRDSDLARPSSTVHKSMKNINVVAFNNFITKDIYVYNGQFKQVIEELGKIDPSVHKYYYDVTKIRKIKSVLNKEKSQFEKIRDGIRVSKETIEKLITISGYNQTESKDLNKYLDFLKEQLKYFNETTVDKELLSYIVLFTLFYGFDKNSLNLVYRIIGKEKKDFKNYVFLINELLINRADIPLERIGFEFTLTAPLVAIKLEREDIEKYLEYRKEGQTHIEAFNKFRP
jgi:hypothetical protein